jgi:hypothetical protein
MENGITLTRPPVFFLYERSTEEAVKADNEGSTDIDMAFPVPPGSMAGGGVSFLWGTRSRIVHKGH